MLKNNKRDYSFFSCGRNRFYQERNNCLYANLGTKRDFMELQGLVGEGCCWSARTVWLSDLRLGLLAQGVIHLVSIESVLKHSSHPCPVVLTDSVD